MYDLSSLAVALVFPLVCSFFLSRFGILLSSVIYWFCYFTQKCCETSLSQMKKYFYTWDPLKDPTYGLHTIQQWKSLLEDYNNQYAGNSTDMDVFQRLLWDVWLPYLRTTIL